MGNYISYNFIICTRPKPCCNCFLFVESIYSGFYLLFVTGNVCHKTNHFTSLKCSTEVAYKHEQRREAVAAEQVLDQRPSSSKLKAESNVLERFFSDSESALSRSNLRAKHRSSEVKKATTSTSSAQTSANASDVTNDSYSNAVIDEFLAVPTSADRNDRCKRKLQLDTRNPTKIFRTTYLAEPDESNCKFLDEIFFDSS